MKMNIFRVLTVAAVFAALPSFASHSGPYDYYTLPPCRVVDTRNPTATNGGPILAGGVTRTFAIRGACGVPMNARAVTLNVTVTGASAASYVTLWSPDLYWQPSTGTIHFKPTDLALANGAIVAVSPYETPDLNAEVNEGSVHLLLDVTGYFK